MVSEKNGKENHDEECRHDSNNDVLESFSLYRQSIGIPGKANLVDPAMGFETKSIEG